MKGVLRYALALGLLVGLVFVGFRLDGSEEYGRSAAFALGSGALFGYFLQRSRFCFFCILRDFFEERNGRGVLGIAVALAIGMFGYAVMFSSQIYEPEASVATGWTEAHIGPVSWVLVLGGILFGWGMALSGSCISAHLYRLSEGSPLAPFALLGAAAGFGLGFASWNFFYRNALAEANVPWLPEAFGYFGALLVQALLLGVLVVYVLLRRMAPDDPEEVPPPDPPPYTLSKLWNLSMVRRWPAWAGGVGVGLLGVLTYYRTEPIGVTAEIGRLTRQTADRFGALPERLQGLDGFAGCATAVRETLISQNGIFVLALIAGAFVASLPAGRFRPVKKPLKQFPFAFAGGILLGFGAMISLGCSIGTLLSGISALAVSGWVFGLAMTFGVWSGLFFRRRFVLN